LILEYTRGHHKALGLGVAMLVFEAITAVVEAYPLAYLIDYLRHEKPALTLPYLADGLIGTVAVLTIAILVIAMTNSLGDSMAEIYFARSGRALGYKLRIALFSHLQRLSLAFHDRRRTGDVITRVTGDVKEIEEFMIDSVSDFVASVLLLAGTLGFLLFYSWQVALVAVLIIPVLAGITNFFSQRIKAASKLQRAQEGGVASTTEEMLTSIRVVQTFGGNPKSERRFRRQSMKAMDAALDSARLQAWFSWIVSVFQAVSIGAVVWIGLWLNRRGVITLGILVLFVILIENMFKPTRKIIQQWNLFGKLYASVERVADLLEREVTVKDAPGALVAPRFHGGIEFEHVTFSYRPDPQDESADTGSIRALTDVSFRIEPGEVVGLVGHTGAGKSTIAQLLPRLYDPQEGRVLLDGHDVRSFTLESLRSQIAVVLQETTLFSGTVAENIGYGKPEAKAEEIVEAAVRANAHEFISRLPNGYESRLSEKATNLSGGQKQRIAIARALIRGTPYLILDEPTSGLDAEATELVLQGLRALMRGKTTLLISHDLGLIRSADRILVLRDGEIEQQGTHAELIREGGLYAALYTRQFDAPSGPAGRARSWREESDPFAGPLTETLPGLSTALDPSRMRGVITGAMGARRGRRAEVSDVMPGKAVLDDTSCTLRYEVTVANGREAPASWLVGARVFAEPGTATTFMASRVEALEDGSQEGLRSVPFGVTAAAIDEPPMVLYAFPIDPELPTLLRAAGTDHMSGVLARSLPADFGRPTPGSLRIEVAHYPRKGHCLLRYLFRDPGGGVCVVYGKLGAGRGRPSDGASQALHDALRGRASGPPVRIPRILSFVPELDLTLTESIPGIPIIASLVKQATIDPGSQVARMEVERAVEAAAEIAAAVHGSGASFSSTVSLPDRIGEIRGRLLPLRSLAPRLAERLEGWSVELERFGSGGPAMRAVPSHGDYTPGQVLFKGNSSRGLVDLDAACAAEPALDVGRFSAYLRAVCYKAGVRTGTPNGPLSQELCNRLVGRYGESAGFSIADREWLDYRVKAFEAETFLQMTMRSWYQLKPDRSLMALSLTEERMSCLR
jgi:ABC-type multidrug transport system fused ATPase/permease subunit